jgi:hypothetical protein
MILHHKGVIPTVRVPRYIHVDDVDFMDWYILV